MPAFIDLQRRFTDLTASELEDPELLASMNERAMRDSIGWPELLQNSRVVILAEAGAGKTREMIEQTNRLIAEEQFAFFVALESLDREPLIDLLSASQEVAFENWKADGQAPAWFFLDAVDELKLTEGKLERALLRLSKSINGLLDRARVIISCRPNDWRPGLDLATVQDKLPVPAKETDTPSVSADEVFLNALRREGGGSESGSGKEQPTGANSAVRTVVMLPMSDRQISLYAQQSGVHDASAFLAEIDRQNAWIFARRPLDLAELIAAWTSSGRLGTRTEQHEANIASKLKDAPDRPDRDVLTEVQARIGAERLALALALTRTRTLRSPDQSLDIHRTEGVLDPAAILQDWTEAERQALLRRALFDPATYGRVRFHHRSVQEYLAAQRLKALREKGMPIKALFRLLFAERYGVEVVFPSMRPIAAWLALWDDSVRQELMKREPEALLSLGDPETLSLGARAQLVRKFVEAYGQGGWRGLNIPIDEVRRLAHPELAPLIRELWGEGPTNSDVRELLIELIWQGPIEGCANLVHAAALNTGWEFHHRVSAIRALIACGKAEAVRQVAEDILAHPTSWPGKIVYSIAPDLFLNAISVDELMTLMERTSEPKRTVGGFNWAARQVVDAVDPRSEQAIALRDRLADLVWNGRSSTQEFYRIQGKFDHLTPALAMLCDRQLNAIHTEADAALIRACVIASRFGEDDGGLREPVSKLRAHFQDGETLRSYAFWAELAFMDEVVPAKDDWNRFYHAASHSLVGYPTEADRPWLKAALADESYPERHAVALHALIQLWHQHGRSASEVGVLRARLNGDGTLEAILEAHTAPPPRNEELENLERESQQRKVNQAAREVQRLQNWKKWRDEVLADPVEAFSSPKLADTVANFHSWLKASTGERSRFDVWNKEAITRAFGPEIADLAEKAFRSLWRAMQPKLWAERAPEERNSHSYTLIYGLCGVAADAVTPGWACKLSSDEARIAAAFSTIELNGFAPFIHDLVETHPAEVEAVIGGELSTQLGMGGDYSHLPTLQDLTYTEDGLKRLLAPRLLAALPTWPSTFTDETGTRWAHHLEQVLRILDGTSGNPDRQAIAKECARRYVASPNGPLALVWLRGVFRFDAERGTQVLTEELTATDDADTRARAIAAFASLFGERDTVLFGIEDPARRAHALGQLVRIAYAFIRREDDQPHDGIYTPDTRDNAESARNFLLSSLLDTPGPEARRVILELAGEPDFAHFSDRLRFLARQRTAGDAEFAPFDAVAVAALENCYEAPPHDRDGLFTVMLDRLDDLAHDLAHNDFTDRRTLRSITDEAEMQRTLAWRLDAKANGAYLVTREDEVADQKRTDIRLSAVRGNQKAVSEVKLADQRWALSDLERALRSQLVGQYLRHDTCKAGCLLLTYDGKKKYWVHPSTGKRMNFSEMVAYLNQRAHALEAENLQEIRLAVFGLDLTDPQLAPAHR